MLPEIGSNFWEYDIDHPRTYKFWWENGTYHTYFFKSGRNATKALGVSLQKANEKKILLPAYLCETEVDPWKDLGWTISFYQINRDFTICVDDLQRKIELFHPALVMVQSYFGFLQGSKGLNKVLESYRNSHGIVIEDTTQSLFTDKTMCDVDFYVASLRKFIAIPDGGVLISREELGFDSIERSDNKIEEIAKKAFSTKKEYFTSLNPETKSSFRKLYQSLNDLIVANDKLYEISPLSSKIFSCLNYDKVCISRKQNYFALYHNLYGFNQISIATRNIILTDKYVPLYLSIYLKSPDIRNLIRSEMAKNDV